MDFFYDGQVRRYVTQFMRIFIGFKWQAGDGTTSSVPVLYGDMTRQVAAIIRENSENKMPSVPKISCYISNLAMDQTRLADPTFVSKINIRERAWEDVGGSIEYKNYQGAGYTVERLMPTPFKLTMKADIWTSNTDQKLQLMEQILTLFNPSLEIQTTDNYIDWTSLSVVYLSNITFSSRTIPQGAESEIDICTLEFEMPIYITPPAKVKKLGIVRNLIMNIFNEQGDIANLEDLVYNGGSNSVQIRNTWGEFGVLLLSSNNGISSNYDVSVLSPAEAVSALGLEPPAKLGERLDWNKVLDAYGGYLPGVSMIYFLQPDGTEMRGTFVINEVDPTYLLVDMDLDGRPGNDFIIDAIIDPYKYNPIETFGSHGDIPVGVKFLVLDDVNNSENVGQFVTVYNKDTGLDEHKWTNPSDSSFQAYDGPDAWKNISGEDTVIKANSIIEWNGSDWITIFDPSSTDIVYISNLKTGIQYKWIDGQWLKSFEGEYSSGYWRFDLNP